jgi:predicted 3-demethylubiquinone-9 3-methyltransferase (glyoxalase superfamily)
MRKNITFMLLGVLLFGCTNFNKEDLNQIKQERDSLLSVLKLNKTKVNNQIVSFLTFQENNAEEAMTFYVDLFDNSKIIEAQRYKKGDPGKEGSLKIGKFLLNGIPFACSDSYIKHEWTFTPGISLFVELNTEAELTRVFQKLSEGGRVMMPLDNYGFSTKFGFVEDKFGVSWQLNLK